MSEKIGIITCSNAATEMDCCAAPCLRDLNQHLGSFKEHHESPPILAGMITCAGCPTLAYPEKIMRKVKSLIEYKISTIHFSCCMVSLCPFLNKYIEIISEEYPDVRLIKGTHATTISHEQFREYFNIACRNHLNMNDIIKGRVTDDQKKPGLRRDEE